MPWVEAPAPAKDHPLVPHPLAGDAQRAVNPGEDDGGRALDVVVERAELVAEAGELEERVLLEEVLPLQHHAGEDLLDRGHERVDELLVLRPAHARVAHAQVQGVVQPLLVVRPHVERDRERAVGGDARAEGVEAELADRNAHPARALVAQPQDPLAVGHHDHRRVGDAGVQQDLLDAVPVLVGDVQAAAAPVDVGVLLARLAHHRGVDDRHHLVDVLEHQAVEQRLVAVLEARQVDELLEVGRLHLEVLVRPVELLVHGADGRRHQAEDVELVALPPREGGALVRVRVQQQPPSLQGHGHVLLAGRRVDLDAEAHRDRHRSRRDGLRGGRAHGSSLLGWRPTRTPRPAVPRAMRVEASLGKTLRWLWCKPRAARVLRRPSGRDWH